MNNSNLPFDQTDADDLTLVDPRLSAAIAEAAAANLKFDQAAAASKVLASELYDVLSQPLVMPADQVGEFIE